MTLIIALGNRDQVMQISDRLLTIDGTLREDESNKAGTFFCADARLIYGFTGLARIGDFETNRWLIHILTQCAPPDFTAYKTLERLKERANQDFQNLPALRHLNKIQKQLTVMFSGYRYHLDPPLAVYAILTNCMESIIDPANPDRFQTSYWGESRPINQEFTFVQRVGFWTAMEDQDVDSLRTLLLELKPAKAIVGKAVEIMHLIADRPKSKGTIGKQLTTIVLPRDPAAIVTSDYYSNVLSYKSYIPDMVFAQGPKSPAAVSRISLQPVDPSNTPPISVPKARPNEPCPCGSGKKYRKCHGIRRK
jgi:hypothetical protein